MKFKPFILVLLIAGSPSVLQAQTPGEKPGIVSLCALIAHGAELDGRLVRLRAQYTTDLNHRSFFFDPNCKKGFVDAYDPDHKDDSIKTFDRALRHHAPFSSLTFYVDASGTFRWDKNWQPPLDMTAFAKPQPHGSLKINKIWHFERLPDDIEKKLPKPN